MKWYQKLFNKWFGWEYIVATTYSGDIKVVRFKFIGNKRVIKQFIGGWVELGSGGKILGEPYVNADYVSWEPLEEK